MMKIFGGFVMLISFYGLEQGSDLVLAQSFLIGLFMFISEYLFVASNPSRGQTR